MPEYKGAQLTGQIPNILQEPPPQDTSLGDTANYLAKMLDEYTDKIEKEKDLGLVAGLQRNLGELEQRRVDAEGGIDYAITAANAERDRLLNILQYEKTEAEGIRDAVEREAYISGYNQQAGIILQEFNAKLMSMEEGRAQLRRDNQSRAISLYRQYVAENPLLQQEFSRALNIFKDFQSLNTGFQSDAQQALVKENAEVVRQAALKGTTPDVIRYQNWVTGNHEAAKQSWEESKLRGEILGPELTVRLTELAVTAYEEAVYKPDGLFEALNAMSLGAVNDERVNILSIVNQIKTAKHQFIASYAQRVKEANDYYAQAGKPVAISQDEINRIRTEQMNMFDLLESYVTNGEYLKLKEHLEANVSEGFLRRISQYMMGIGDEVMDSWIASVKATKRQSEIVETFLAGRKIAVEAMGIFSKGYGNLDTLYQIWGMGSAGANPDATKAMQYLQSQLVIKPQLEREIFKQLQDDVAAMKFMAWITGQAAISSEDVKTFAPTWTFLLSRLGAKVPEKDRARVAGDTILSGNTTTNAALADPNNAIHSTTSQALRGDPAKQQATFDRLSMDADHTMTMLGGNRKPLEALVFDPATGFSFTPFTVERSPNAAMSAGMVGGILPSSAVAPPPIAVNTPEEYNRNYNGLLEKLNMLFSVALNSYGPEKAAEVGKQFMQKIFGEGYATPAQEAVSQPQQPQTEEVASNPNDVRQYDYDELADRIVE